MKRFTDDHENDAFSHYNFPLTQNVMV